MRIKALLSTLVNLATRRSESALPLSDTGEHTSFKTLLVQANDFDLCDGTYVKITSRSGRGLSTHREVKQVVLFVWHASGIIDNGGFEYLFSGTFAGDPEFRSTAEAFRTIGLTRSYEAFQRAFALFPGGRLPHNGTDRMAIYGEVDEKIRESLNEMVWRDHWDKLREPSLADYIRKNAAQFADLDMR